MSRALCVSTPSWSQTMSSEKNFRVLPITLSLLVFLCACNDQHEGAISPEAVRSDATESQPHHAATTGPASLPATSGPARTRPWQPPQPPAAQEHKALRHRMVRSQLVRPYGSQRAIRDPQVLEAMRTVPRHVFVPQASPMLAYADRPLPIGHRQTISQPYIVALMTELLELTPESKVLEVGTGSGYQAAVLAHLTPEVYTIEIVEPLARQAMRRLEAQGYDEVQCRIGDGYQGWPEAAPFDGIIVTCAADNVPEPLWEQLAVGGRMVIPLGRAGGVQELIVLTKTADGEQRRESVIPVRFVPMTGRVRQQ
jgi:protein-L-isoaspartate(D-aspartate) O-methyltransferase